MKKRINKIFSGKHFLVRLPNYLFKFLAVLSFIGMNHSFIANAQLKLPAIPTNTQLSYQYEYNAEYIYRVMSGTDYLEDGAILAYVNGQLRGAQTASELFPPTGLIEYKIRIFSNLASGDIISFRYYDIFNAKIFEITEEEIFIADNVPDYYTPSILNTYCGAPGIATGLLPEDQAKDQNATQDLFWQPSENTTHYSLFLWKDGDPEPTSPKVSTIYGTSTRVYNLVYGEIYHWYILSVNQCLQDTSTTQTFTVRDLPDLVVTELSASDTILSASPFTVDYSVKNQDVGSTLGTLWYDAVYISADNVFSGDDYYLGQIERLQALEADSSYTQSISASAPSDYAGNYYLFVVTDQRNNIPESDNDNNINPQALAIYVQEKPLPDVKVSGIGSNSTIVEPGDTLEFSWDIENIGDAAAIGGWTEKVAIVSLSGVRVNLSGTPQFSATLEKGASTSRTYQFILPEIISFSGEAYIEVEVIPSNELIEYPGDEVNNKAISLNRINLQSKLYLSIPSSVIENYTGLIRCYVSRSGNYTEELTVNLTPSMSGELNIPTSLIIPARSSSAVFNITTIDNALLDGPRDISIEASASAYTSQSQVIKVLDDEIPSIALAFNKTTATEGDTLLLNISRDLLSPDSSVIYLSSNQSAQWSFPNSVTIEANQLSAEIVVLITDNTIPELNAEAIISARSEGLISGSATATILDDDIPLIELDILSDSVSEGAGPYATWGVIRRIENSSNSIRVNLSADTPNALFFPASITLDSDVMEKQFNIGVVDNAMVDGFRTIKISGSIYISSCNCNTSSENGGVVTSELIIADNDGPSLSVTVNPASLAEGKTNAGTITIFRNTSTAEALEVTLSTNDDSELSIPSNAIILAGQTSVQVPIDTKDDNIDDGSQIVSLQANATGYSPGMAWVYVTDINRPDLEINDIELSENSVITKSQLEVQAIIQNNGYGTAPSGVKIKLYLSEDEIIDENDTVIYESSLPDPIGIGESAQYLELITVPDLTGNYYLLAKVNPEGDISELLYINNESSSVQLSILPNYIGTAIVDEEMFFEPIPVSIHGEASLINGGPASNENLDVYIISDGIRRVLEVETDDDGIFSTSFEPYAYESGHYIVGACFPGQDMNEEQDAFDILGMERVSKDYLTWNIKKNVPVSGTIGIKNRSNVPLTNLIFEPLSVPDGFELSIDTITNLPGSGISYFNFILNGTEITQGINYIEVPVKVSSAEGISFEFSAYYYCQALGSNLESNPASINTTMTKGKSRYYDLQIFNNGAGETGKMSIEIPELDWMTLASVDSLETLASGDTISVTLLLSPNNDLPLNTPLTGRIVAHNSNGDDLVIPYHIEMVSEESGSLRVDVVDEYTYFTDEAPHVENAHVVIRHPYSGVIMAEGFTDFDGFFEVDSLPEGSYKMTVEVEKHEGYQNVIVIDPGRVNEQLVFLSFQAITYTWEVVPTEIEDSYEIELVMEFETNVPAPVVIIEMPTEMPELVNDETYTFMVTLTNKGLIRAEDVELRFPENDIEYEWVSNYTKMDLLAQQAIQIPVVMRIRDSKKSAQIDLDASSTNATESGGGACTGFAVTIYGFECGPDRQWNQTSALFTISGRICSGTGGGGTIGGGGIGPGGGTSGSSSASSSTAATVSPSTGCDPCLISTLTTLLGCFGGNVGGAIACLYSMTDGDFSGMDAAGCIPGPIGCTVSVISTLRTCYNSPPWGGGGLKKTLLDELSSELNEIPPIMLQAVEDLERWAYYDSLSRAYYSEYMGSLDWLSKESFGDFVLEFDPIVSNKLTFDNETIAAIKLNMSGTDISEEEIDVFVNRWNMTMEAWGNGIFSPNNDYPVIVDRVLIDHYISEINSMFTYAQSRGYESVGDMHSKAFQTLKDEVEGGRSSVCASVSIKISQELVMTREAFEGTLTIFNGHTSVPMDEIELNVEIRDENGELSNDLFQIETKALDILTGIDGTGSLDAELTGSATMLFIPEKGAAPEVPKAYSFGGSFSYLDPFTGVTIEKPLFPVTLQVNPSPDLFLHYFMQRDILGDDALTEPIEPIVPAELAVMIENNGFGTAKSVRIESAQPEIIDNEKGLSIHFALIGSNLNGQPRQLGLTDIDFGNILPKTSSVGQWWFTSDLLGHFVNYEASVTHLDSYGNPDLSLISGAELHELIRSVRVYGATDDGINDFLVNGVQDSQEQPDVIYMSQGNILLDVFGADVGVFEGTIQAPTLTNTLKLIVSKIGWNYIKLSDPGYGKYEILSVTRNSDQQEIPLDNVWLSHVTLPDGKEPVYENKFHFVDIFENFGEQEYTIVWKLKDPDPPGVVSIEGAPQSFVSQPLTSVTVKFNKEIEPSTFSYADMTLRLQGGDDIMDSTTVITQIDEFNYSVDLSSLTTGNGFYVLTVQAAEIEDLGGTKGNVGKQVSWTQFLSVPVVEEFIGLDLDYVGSSFDFLLIRFNLPIDINTLTSSRFILAKDGVPVSGSLTISIMDTEAKLFRISGMDAMMTSDGEYSLTIDLLNIATLDGEKGLVQQSVEWSIDTTAPLINLFTKITEGGFDEQHVTGMEIVFSEDIRDFDLSSVELWLDDSQQPLSQVHLDSLNTISYEMSQFRLLTYYPGTYTLKVNMSSVYDRAGISGSGITEYQWIVDRTPPNPVENLRISPDLGYSDTDGITSTPSLTALMNVIEDDVKIELYKNDFGTLTLLANTSIVNSGELAIDVIVPSTGNVLLEAHCIDEYNNLSITQLPIFVDEKAFQVSFQEVPLEPVISHPEFIKLVFTEKILESSLDVDYFALTKKGTDINISNITLEKISDSLYTISGFNVLDNDPGDYIFSIDLRNIKKYISGMQGTYVATATWTIINANVAPVANAGEDFDIVSGIQYWLDGSESFDENNDQMTYQWFPPEGITLDNDFNVNPSFIAPQDTGTFVFTFILLVSDGALTSTDKVSASLPNVSGTDNPTEDSRILLYPNPCSEYFTVTLDETIVNSFHLIDFTGKVLMNQKWSGEKEQMIHLNNIPGGIYFLQINTSDKILMKKLIVL